MRASHWLSHLEFDWESPVWRPWLTELSRGRTLVRYDDRASGLSDWDVADISFDSWFADLEAVVSAAGLARFALFGMSRGAPLAIAYAVREGLSYSLAEPKPRKPIRKSYADNFRFGRTTNWTH